MASSSSDDRRDESAKEIVHKTKVIQFLGRTTPIVLQNDNGPCPLLSICNVLLLKNIINLSPDVPQVSQEKLLSLVAERLLDSNSNPNNKDAGFVENQQQNISDAIDLLPRLTTGIDVNIKFRRIDDFEFTRECAIFDLLDIPLYHGWIVDPEDSDTANAIGSKSYNTLMGELVSLETQNVGNDEYKQNPGEEYVDFAAATTATLGVPSPCLSRGRSFDESPRSASNDTKLRKGDLEEEAELLKALRLSENLDNGSNVNNDLITFDNIPMKGDCLAPKNDEGNACDLLKDLKLSEKIDDERNVNNDPVTSENIPVEDDCLALKTDEGSANGELNSLNGSKKLDDVTNVNNDPIANEKPHVKDDCFASKNNEGNENDQSISDAPDNIISKDIDKETNANGVIESENALLESSDSEIKNKNCGGDEHVKEQCTPAADCHESKDSLSSNANAEADISGGKNVNILEALTPVGDGSEPIYEGEERILDSRTTTYNVEREPMYEGEVVLAEQVEKDSKDAPDISSKDAITPKQGELIRNFLNNSASQLTVYGLFRLQEGPKERELCVFFRNNHFSTMFKFDGELYLLATDQGYLNQPDLVWEKLNEVNGNTFFMTSNFKEFKVDSPTNNNTWDEQNAVANTADYLANIDNSAQAHSNFTSDLELAIALQQQEYEQQQQQEYEQQQQQQQHNVDRTNVTGGSRLVTGPQRPRSSSNHPSSTSRPEPKQNKDKCIVM